MHNDARARMNAATMPALVWDADLQAVASAWANQCTNSHNNDRTAQYDARTGSTDYVGTFYRFLSSEICYVAINRLSNAPVRIRSR